MKDVEIKVIFVFSNIFKSKITAVNSSAVNSWSCFRCCCRFTSTTTPTSPTARWWGAATTSTSTPPSWCRRWSMSSSWSSSPPAARMLPAGRITRPPLICSENFIPLEPVSYCPWFYICTRQGTCNQSFLVSFSPILPWGRHLIGKRNLKKEKMWHPFSEMVNFVTFKIVSGKHQLLQKFRWPKGALYFKHRTYNIHNMTLIFYSVSLSCSNLKLNSWINISGAAHS